jgi:serine/threonine protein kinase
MLPLKAEPWLTRCADYLHSLGMVHRDVKAANVVFSDTGDVMRLWRSRHR